MKPVIALVAVSLMLALLPGCGSGGGDASVGTRLVTLSGKVQQPDKSTLPTTLQAVVVGTSISAPVHSDATFTLVDVPSGSQTIGVVNTTDPAKALVSVEI